jgi:hypothetical protein
MSLERQQDVTDLGEQLGLDPRPLESPGHPRSPPFRRCSSFITVTLPGGLKWPKISVGRVNE